MVESLKVIKTNENGKVIAIYKICKNCQKEFNSLKGKEVGRAKKRIFCSRKCLAMFRAKTVKGKDHHCWNGDRWDNRIENLLLTTKAEHARLHGKERGAINGRI